MHELVDRHRVRGARTRRPPQRRTTQATCYRLHKPVRETHLLLFRSGFVSCVVSILPEFNELNLIFTIFIL